MGSGPGSNLQRVLVMDTGTGHATTCRCSCTADLRYSTFMYVQCRHCASGCDQLSPVHICLSCRSVSLSVRLSV